MYKKVEKSLVYTKDQRGRGVNGGGGGFQSVTFKLRRSRISNRGKSSHGCISPGIQVRRNGFPRILFRC